MNTQYIGFILVIISSIGFGLMPIFASFAYANDVSVEVVLLFRFLIAAILLNIYILIKNKSYPWGKSLMLLVAMGAFGYSSQAFTYFSALSLIGSSFTTILFYLYPSFVLLLSIGLLKAKISKRDVIALLFTTTGLVLAVGLKFNDINYIGVMFAIASAVIYAIYILVGTVAFKKVDTLVASTIIISASAVVYITLGITNDVSMPTSINQWQWLFAIAVISTIISIVTFFAGLKLIGPVKTSMLSTFEPIVTIFSAFLVLNESMDIFQIFGAILVITGAIILAK